MALAAAEVVVLDMNQAESLAGPAGGSDLEDRGAFPAEARWIQNSCQVADLQAVDWEGELDQWLAWCQVPKIRYILVKLAPETYLQQCKINVLIMQIILNKL